MLNVITRNAALVLAICFTFTAVSAVAESDVETTSKKTADKSLASNSGAHQAIAEVSERLLVVVDKHRATLAEKPEPYYAEVQDVLEPVVAFSYIARSVMGDYRNQASDDQQVKFAEIFKRSLVSTYAKGMTGYTKDSMTLLPPQGDVSDQRRVMVKQEVKDSNGVNSLVYSMAKNRQGEWKLINVILNGINLGETFKNQFETAMQKNNNDVGAVISGWDSDNVKTKS